MTQFLNHYRCPNDGHEWDDTWDSTCNDRCPVCNAEIEPFASEDLPDEQITSNTCPSCEQEGTLRLKERVFRHYDIRIGENGGVQALPDWPPDIDDDGDLLVVYCKHCLWESEAMQLGEPHANGLWFEEWAVPEEWFRGRQT